MPGLNFIYAHINRAVRAHDLNVMFVTGPPAWRPGAGRERAHGGTYSEVYPHIGHDEEGLRRSFRQFSFPGGMPSHRTHRRVQLCVIWESSLSNTIQGPAGPGRPWQTGRGRLCVKAVSARDKSVSFPRRARPHGASSCSSVSRCKAERVPFQRRGWRHPAAHTPPFRTRRGAPRPGPQAAARGRTGDR
jgi:hypothetical protein